MEVEFKTEYITEEGANVHLQVRMDIYDDKDKQAFLHQVATNLGIEVNFNDNLQGISEEEWEKEGDVKTTVVSV